MSPARRALTALACALVALGVGACSFTQPDPAAVIARIEKKQRARTDSSLDEWRERRIGRTDALSYVNRRTAWLLIGAKNVMVKGSGDGWIVSADGAQGGWGSAAAVTPDGYFLTSAHCVDPKAPITLVAWTGENRLARASARVVWRGKAEGDDIALIKADIDTPYFFPLAAKSTAQPHDAVLMSGFGAPNPHQGGGRIIAIEATQRNDRGASWRTILHSTPMVRGDSGSPLVDARGRLVGINSTILAEYRRLPVGFLVDNDIRTASISLDPAWIRRQIARDRRGRAQ